MATKYNLPLLYLITTLAICSCRNTDNSKDKKHDETTLQTANKPTTATELPVEIGGTYSFGENAETEAVGSVIVYPLADNSALFFLDVCRGAPSYNLGQLFGTMTIQDNIGTYDSKVDGNDFNCVLKFKFSSRQLDVTTEANHNDCGFGGNVYADNEYKLTDKSIPKYFINGEGDTILFEGLTVEKYEHRFD